MISSMAIYIVKLLDYCVYILHIFTAVKVEVIRQHCVYVSCDAFLLKSQWNALAYKPYLIVKTVLYGVDGM